MFKNENEQKNLARKRTIVVITKYTILFTSNFRFSTIYEHCVFLRFQAHKTRHFETYAIRLAPKIIYMPD